MGLSVGSRGPLFDYKLDHISFQTLFWSMDLLVKISHKNWSTFLLQKTANASEGLLRSRSGCFVTYDCMFGDCHDLLLLA
jgi:hypothetical protein